MQDNHYLETVEFSSVLHQQIWLIESLPLLNNAKQNKFKSTIIYFFGRQDILQFFLEVSKDNKYGTLNIKQLNKKVTSERNMDSSSGIIVD